MAMEVLEESQQALPPSNWWVDLARDASNNIVPVEGETIEAFARKCYRLFFQQKMGKEMYFQCCTLAWMVQCLDRGMMAEQLWKATRLVLHHQVQMVMDGEDSCLTGWILPTFQMQDLDLPGTVPLGDSEERYIYLLIHLWKQFYKACEEPLPARPIKRQRTTYHYYSSSTSPLDDLMKGSYKLSTVILWSNVILNIGDSIHSWQELHDLVHLLPRIFKTLTADDIQAGLAVVGMQCLMDGTKISGLTPGALLNNYLTRTGESTLSVLKESLTLDYYPLRAVICEHLLEPIYSPDDSNLTEQEIQATIRACCGFLNREQPSLFLQQIQQPIKLDTAGCLPPRIQSPRFPLITHLSTWLLNDDLTRATDLARLMEKHPHLDASCKDEAYLMIWQHLLRQGILFLDGNFTETSHYIQKRELLYNGIVNGMGPFGRGSMMDFYQALAQKVWDHGDATPEEKQYILLASQQTLLRLLLKCRGFGDATLVEFLKETQWPVAVQEIKAIASTDINAWAVKFLAQRNPIPESLLSANEDGTGVVDLNRFVDNDDNFKQSVQIQEHDTRQVSHDQPTQQMDTIPTQFPKIGEEADTGIPDAYIDDHQQEPHEEEKLYYEQDTIDIDDNDNAEGEEEDEDEVEEVELDQSDDPPNNDDKDEELQDNDDEIEVAAAARQSDHEDSTAEMDSNDAYEYEDQDDSPQGHRSRAKRDDDDYQYSSSGEENEEQRRLERPVERKYSDEGNHHHQGEDYSSSEDDEQEEAEEDSSSDGGDDGGENEAVVIQDSEDDDDEPTRRSRAFYGNIRRNLDDHSDGESSGVEEDQNVDEEDSDGHDDDVSRDGPHRIDQGEVDDMGSDESEDDGIREVEDIQAIPPAARRENQEQLSSDEEEHDNDRIPVAPAVVAHAIEIIDCSDDEDEKPSAAMKHESSPTSQPSESNGPIEQQHEVARAMVAMFDLPSNVDVCTQTPLDHASLKEDHPEADSLCSSTETEKVNLNNDTTRDQESDFHDSKVAAENNTTKDKIGGSKSGIESHEKSPIDVDSNVLENEAPGDDYANVEEPQHDDEDGHDSQDDSNATDDEDERVIEVEKAETEEAAVGGDFGDTTEEENDKPTSSKANMLADADRRADVMRARSGYASQLEEGYEPEDTHGYTEEEVSEAIHTDDEEEHRRTAQKSPTLDVMEQRRNKLDHVEHSMPHSSDDMDAADERTEPEEDLGAESSELEETTEARDYAYSPSSEVERDPTTLLEFAQSAQRLHQYGSQSVATKIAAINQGPETVVDAHVHTGDKSAGIVDGNSDDIVGRNVKQWPSNENEVVLDPQSREDQDDVVDEATSDNFASVEDEKEAESTMATESIELTEDTVDPGDSEDVGPSKDHASKHSEDVHDVDTDIDDIANDNDGFPEEQAENAYVPTEMAIDSTVEPQDAMITETIWPGIATTNNLMDTDSPMQASGHEMDVDDMGARVDDQAMTEGVDAFVDETMDPAPTVENAAAMEIFESFDHEIQDLMKTDDETSTRDAFTKSGAAIVFDSIMDTQPTSTMEVHHEASLRVEAVEEIHVLEHSPLLEDNEDNKIQVEVLQSSERIDEVSEENRSSTKELSQEVDQTREDAFDRVVSCTQDQGDAILPSHEGLEVETEKKACVEKETDKSVRVSTATRSSEGGLNLETGDSRPTEYLVTKPQVAGNNQITIRDGNSDDCQQSTIEEAVPPVDDATNAQPAMKPKISTDAMDSVEVGNQGGALVDRSVPERDEINEMESVDGRDEELVPPTRAANRKPRSSKRVALKKSINDDSIVSLGRRSRNAAATDDDESVNKASRTTRGSSKEPDENEDSTARESRTTSGRARKSSVKHDMAVEKRTTRGRAKKLSIKDDESVVSEPPTISDQIKEPVVEGKKGSQAGQPAIESEESVVGATQTTRDQGNKLTAEDESLVATQTTPSQSKKPTTNDSEDVTSVTETTRNFASDDDKALVESMPTPRGQAKETTIEEDASIGSGTRRTRGRVNKSTADDDEESVVSGTRSTRARKLATGKRESTASATRTSRTRANDDHDESAVSGTPTTRARTKKPAITEDEPIVRATSTPRKGVKEVVDEEDESVLSVVGTPRGRANKHAGEDDESTVSATRATRGRTKKQATDETESAASVPRTPRGRGKKPAGEDDESVVSGTRTTRGRTKKQAADEDESIVSVTRTPRANKPAGEDSEPVVIGTMTTRGRARKQDTDEDESVASSTRTPRGRAKRSATDEEESVVSASRTTRGRARKSIAEKQEPVSSGKRTIRGRAKKADDEEDESIASSTPNTISLSGVKRPFGDDESATSATSSMKGERAKARDDHDDDHESKQSTRESSRKGLPPRAPTRSSTRQRKKRSYS